MGAIDPAGLPDLVPLSATLAPKPIANPEGARRVRPRPGEARGTALELATARGELDTFELLSHDAHNRPMTYGGEQVSVVNGLLIAPSD
jgi:hypothetical protein